MSLILWTQEFAGRDAVELVFQVTTQPGGDTDTVRILVRDAGLSAPSDLVIQDASHSHVSDEIALAQTYNLAIQDGNHGHTVDSLELTQLHILTLQDSLHDHSADNLVLTQVHNLIVAAGMHGHTGENLALTQVHLLVIQSSDHAHTVETVCLFFLLQIHDSFHGHFSGVRLSFPYSFPIRFDAGPIDLVQIVNLTSSDSVLPHSAENINLTQAHSLTIQNASHGHVADNLSLTQAHNLTVAAASHTHTAGNIVLTQAHILGVQDTIHGHTAANAILTQLHQLVIQNSSHSHTVEQLTISVIYHLVIQNSAHSHAVENLTLEHIYVLDTQSALHSHTVEQLDLVTGFITGVVEVQLDPLTDPLVHTDHILRIRARTVEGGGTLYYQLVQTTTVIATFDDTLTTSFTTYEGNLTELEAADISDYTDLRIRWWVEHTDTVTPQVSLVEFAIPEFQEVVIYRPWVGTTGGRTWLGIGDRPRITGKQYVGRVAN